MDWLTRRWHGLLCLLGYHIWVEESRWEQSTVVMLLTVPTLDNAPHGIDFCSRCGARQKFMCNRDGTKAHAEYIFDERT